MISQLRISSEFRLSAVTKAPETTNNGSRSALSLQRDKDICFFSNEATA